MTPLARWGLPLAALLASSALAQAPVVAPVSSAPVAAPLAPAAPPSVAAPEPPAKLLPPYARVADTRETLHGVEVADPYRWLEAGGHPESQAFYRAQGAYARVTLDRLPGRKALLDRIRSLSEYDTHITDVKLSGGRIFYRKLAPGMVNAALAMRENWGAAEVILVDPERFTEGAARGSLDWFVPSPDGRLVAYGAAKGGSENAALRVFDVNAGRDLGFSIDRARFSDQMAWRVDSRSFYYSRFAENDEPRKRYATVRVYRHVLGRDTAMDEVVFAPGVGGARDVPEVARPRLLVPPESTHAYALVREGVDRELAVHITSQKDLHAGLPRWRKIVSPADHVVAVEAWRDDLYLLTYAGAPRNRVVQVRAANPVIARGHVVVPEGDMVIQSFGLAKDAIYIRGQLGGVDRLEKVPLGVLGARKIEYVKTPFDNHIAQLVTDPRRPGAILRLQGWIEPPQVVEVDARSGELRNTRLQPPSVTKFSAMDEVRLYAPSHDGTKIPVTLLYRKTTTMDQQNPTLLIGYGAYGSVPAAAFDATRLAWLERGGIIAIAHIRGGGEYGEAWHKAGQKANKANTILDFIAVAEFLVKFGFTNPKRLALQGTSAGGIAAGGALVRRPDLAAAVVGRVPVMDMLRFEHSPGGPANVPEFGSVATKEGFEALRVMSSYHLVKDATDYPAVLLTAGLNDPRVDAWQPGKMAARLQAASTGGKPVLLRVETDAGHGYGTSKRQREEELADIYAFLLWQFGDPEFQPQ